MEKDRVDRLEKWRELRVNPYPISEHIPTCVVPMPDNLPGMTEDLILPAKICGRVTQVNNLGGLFFIFIKRSSLMQICIRKTDGCYHIAKLLQVGDFISAEGHWFKTSQNKTALLCKTITLLAKGMRDLGKLLRKEDHKDVEELRRKKYLELLVNGTDVLIQRSRLVQDFRTFFSRAQFLEVETRTLLPVNSGANAKPFTAKYNSLGQDFYLRVAPELDLKRLLVGGMQKIFEIGKNFRNEGMDKTHNPEFTSLEAYWAYSSCKDMRGLFLSFLNNLNIKDVTVVSMSDFVGPCEYENLNKKFEEMSSSIISPTIITDYPIYCSPLAKAKDEKFADRFEFFWKGMEIANAFSELNDPVEQRKRFAKEEGDEAMQLDEDFLEALEYGMPPSSGLGIGLDRLIMCLLEKEDINEVIYAQYARKDI